MKKIGILNQEILALTTTIEEKYPELYTFLTETPLSIPKVLGKKVTVEQLKKHLETLRTILSHYLETKALK